jgi:hypothetical protein
MNKALQTLQDTKPGAYSHFKETLKRNGIEIPDIKKPSGQAATVKQVEKDVFSIKKTKGMTAKGAIPRSSKKGLVNPPKKGKGNKSK